MAQQQKPRKNLEVFAMIPYTTRDNEEKTRWVKVGAAFVNRDRSLTVVLDCIPVVPGARLQVRERDDKEDGARDNRPASRGPAPTRRAAAPEPETDSVDELPF